MLTPHEAIKIVLSELIPTDSENIGLFEDDNSSSIRSQLKYAGFSSDVVERLMESKT